MGAAEQRTGIRAEDRDVIRYTLTNARGHSVAFLNFGAVWMSAFVPDRKGDLADVLLGYDDPADYVQTNTPYFGAVCGRVANRIGRGRFTLDGATYHLDVNNGPNHLHGGRRGFSHRLWEGHVEDDRTVEFNRISPEGEEHYPGALAVQVRYQWTDDDLLMMGYSAEASRPTPVNLTNHAYFNLAGPETPDIFGHVLTLDADRITPTDEHTLPRGNFASVEDTAFDFRRPQALGMHRAALPTGYDVCFALNAPGGGLPNARLGDPESGRALEMWTSEPGVQLYTGYYLAGVTGKGGRTYGHQAGVCLEAMRFADAVNCPAFPSVIIRPGAPYKQTTAYRFTVAS